MAPNNEPGVSGKERLGKSWVNPEEYEQQKELLKESNLYGRGDLSNQNLQETSNSLEKIVRDTLRASPEADIAEVEIRVKDSTVVLIGEVKEIKEAREMIKIVQNIPRVERVVNLLHIVPH